MPLSLRDAGRIYHSTWIIGSCLIALQYFLVLPIQRHLQPPPLLFGLQTPAQPTFSTFTLRSFCVLGPLLHIVVEASHDLLRGDI